MCKSKLKKILCSDVRKFKKEKQLTFNLKKKDEENLYIYQLNKIIQKWQNSF